MEDLVDDVEVDPEDASDNIVRMNLQRKHLPHFTMRAAITQNIL